ncbi:MAG TPA: nitrate ABC transporter ATP-binding protein, partial [Candidatus Limnocylindria bacterium]|nr:nitrate ABC transporter ATP-binding protein [Candidatus Limnocylindria bacterium]
ELLAIWERTRQTIVYVTHNISEAVYMADRVVVLSRRPGRVLADIAVGLERPRVESMMGKPAFVHAVERIWSLIKDHAQEALRE